MIDLRTGIPGSGKTLSMVEALNKLLLRWEKHPEEARAIFVHNIKNLALPHAVLPLTDAPGKGGQVQIIPDWEALPDGSLVIIDECQDLFPPRSSQTAAPAHIAWFNTHRHKGFDVWITTQHPKLIDFSVRALVGKHMHFRRLFGGQRSAVYEWDGCSDNLSGMKDAVMSYYGFPKKAFQFYKSAEVHTKQNFKLPRWLIIPVIGVLLSFYAVPRAYSVLAGSVSGQGLKSSATKEQAKPGGAAIAATGPGVSAQSRPAPPPASPPGNPMQSAAAPAQTLLAGCIAMRNRCECFDAQLLRVEVPLEVCKESSHRVGTLAMPLAVKADIPAQQVLASAPAEAPPLH